MLGVGSSFGGVFEGEVLPAMLTILTLSIYSVATFTMKRSSSRAPSPRPSPMIARCIPSRARPRCARPICARPICARTPAARCIRPGARRPAARCIRPRARTRGRRRARCRGRCIRARTASSARFRTPAVTGAIDRGGCSADCATKVIS